MDYAATITTSALPSEAARKITDDLELWWSARVERHTNGFTIRFNNSHASFAFDTGGTAHEFSWTCIDANMIIEGVADTGEWTGTQLIWSIVPHAHGSAVTMTHRGLTPQLPCFDICQRGWQHFFEDSLRNHLMTRSGTPNTD